MNSLPKSDSLCKYILPALAFFGIFVFMTLTLLFAIYPQIIYPSSIVNVVAFGNTSEPVGFYFRCDLAEMTVERQKILEKCEISTFLVDPTCGGYQNLNYFRQIYTYAKVPNCTGFLQAKIGVNVNLDVNLIALVCGFTIFFCILMVVLFFAIVIIQNKGVCSYFVEYMFPCCQN
jgi:hypothetical protein